MADDDVTLGGDSREAQIAFLQLKDVVEQFLASLGKTGPEAKDAAQALTGLFHDAEIGASEAAKRLPEFYQQFQNATPKVEKLGVSIKDLTKGIGGGISAFAILRQNVSDLGPVLDKLGTSVAKLVAGENATAAETEAITTKFKALINPGKIVASIIADFALANEKAAESLKGLAEEMVGASSVAIPKLTDAQTKANDATREGIKLQAERSGKAATAAKDRDTLAAAIIRETTAAIENGKVTKDQREEITQLNQAYHDAGETVPAAFQKIVDKLGILTTEQEKAKDAATKHAEEAAKAAEQRADAEENAVEREKKALEEATAAQAKAVEERVKALADAEEAYGKSIQDATSDGGNVITSENGAEEAQKRVDELKKKIKELSDTPILTEEQAELARQLPNDLQKATEEAEALSRAAVQGVAPIIDAAEATGLLADNAKVLDAIWATQADDHQKVIDEIARSNEAQDKAAQDAADSAKEFGESAAKAADAVGDTADATKKTADAAEKLGDEGKKGMEEFGAATATAKENLMECESIMLRINAAAAQLASTVAGIDI